VAAPFAGADLSSSTLIEVGMNERLLPGYGSIRGVGLVVFLSLGALSAGCVTPESDPALAEEAEIESDVGEAAQAVTPAQDDWSVVLTTAPQQPQDVWLAAHGDNTEGWNSGGSVCLGVLANDQGPTDPVPAFEPGDHATLLTDVVEAGVFGVDGAPVPPGDYFAPGNALDQSPGRSFTLTPGQSFYIVYDGTVINSSLPAAFPFPVGSVLRLMFTLDYDGEGRQVQPAVLWGAIPDGSGGSFFVPFLNEGEMMLNARRN
jgi:hypothetical protein